MKKTLLLVTSNSLKKVVPTWLALLCLLVVTTASKAQVATNYLFSQVDTGLTYTPITGGTVFASAGFVNTTPVAVPIGFSFNFNGTVYTTAGLTDNGFITFGATLPAPTNAAPISSGVTYAGAVSAFGFNLIAPTTPLYSTPPPSSVQYATVGLPGSQIFIVQYENVIRRTGVVNVPGLINMQIRLYEGTNLIETVYNTFDPVNPVPAPGATPAANGQVGLRGANNLDFNNRVAGTGNWTGTLPSTPPAANAVLFLNNSVFPTNVTAFRWTPCFSPSGLTATLLGDNSTANLSWTAPSIPPAGGYDWEVRTSGDPGSGAVGRFAFGNTSSTSVLIPGLLEGTTYYFYVKSSCRNVWLPSNTAPSTVSILPVCPVATIPYSQNFETATVPGMPFCTTVVAPSGANFVTRDNTSTAFWGFNNKNLITSGNNAQNAWYFTQAIDFPAAGDYRLSYKYGGTREQVFFQQRMRVWYGAANTVAGMTTLLVDHNDIKTSPINNALNFTVPAAGTYYIGFHGYANATNGSLQLDDIVVEVSTCRPPTALIAGTPSSSTAAISWTAPATPPSDGYSYFVSTSPTAPTSITVPTASLPAGTVITTVSGLAASTTYYFWVRSNCGSGEFSSWSTVGTFTTAAPPPPPPAGYCVPTQSGGSNITSVRFNAINNSVVQVSPFYNDYAPGPTTTTIVRVTQTYPLQVATSGASIVSVWIDYNQNAVFEATEWTQVWTDANSGSVNITIPSTALAGSTKMRVRSRLNGFDNAATDACTIFGSGSTQDYTIFIDATLPPVLTIDTATASICSGETTPNVRINSPLGNFNVYSWSPSTGVTDLGGGVYTFSPTTTTVYTLTGQQTSSPFDSNSVVLPVTVRPTPTPIVITPATPTICQNALTGQALTATGGIVSGAVVPGVSENFNGGPGGYSTLNTSTLGTDATRAAWTLRPSPFTTATAVETLRSNDNTQFYTTDSDWHGSGGQTRTQLISPVFDLSTYTDASLSFWHYYRAWINGSATVQISTDGGTNYTDLIVFTSTSAGGPTNFANQVISLNAYTGLGFTNLRLRFIYSADWGYRWSIDNVVVSGTNSSNITWSPTANLFTDPAGLIPYTGTPTATVFVRTTSAAPLSFTATSTGAGCVATRVVPVTVTPVSGGAPSPLNQVLSCTSPVSDLTLTGFSGTVTRWQFSSSPTFASGVVTIPTSNAATLTAAQIGLFSGIRYFRAEVSNGSCTHFSAIASISIARTIWNGSAWSLGAPNNATVAEFQGNYSSTGDLNACSVLVTSGNVVFNGGHTLTVQTTVNVAGGTLTFNDDASLYQVNNVANAPGVFSGGNSGNITSVRDAAPMFRFDYTYWSTPVNPMTLLAVSPGSPITLAYEFNSSINNWSYFNPTNTMVPGRGYIFRAPTSFNLPPPNPIPNTPSVHTASFVGVPNNGTITVPVIGGGGTMNLLGNPYPSALDAADLIAANPAINGTLYFWTHNTQSTAPFAYNPADYASWNGTGFAATTIGAGNSTAPTGFIASGQGFFVEGLSTGTVTYTNAMREPGNNAQFYRTNGSNQSNSTLEKHRYWLNITGEQNAFKQVLVGYIETATNGMDRLFDGKMIDATSSVTLYTKVDDEKLSIQGRTLPFDVNEIVPLGYKAPIAGTYTIALADFDGLFEDQAIYLEDTLSGVVHDLKESSYTFATAVGTFENRFIVRYTNALLGIDNPAFNENTVVVYTNESGLIVNSGTAVMETVTIFDIRGRQLATQKQIGGTTAVFTTLPKTNQVLLVKIEGADGVVVTKKVVY